MLLRFGNTSLSRWGEGGEEGSCAVTMIVGALALVLAWGSCGGAGTGTTRVATTVEEPEEKSRVEKKAWSAEGAKDEPIVVVVVGGRLQSVGGGDELICCCTRLRSYSPRAPSLVPVCSVAQVGAMPRYRRTPSRKCEATGGWPLQSSGRVRNVLVPE